MSRYKKVENNYASMPRELLRLPRNQIELVLLRYPDEEYRIEIYWREARYYEKLAEVNTLSCAQELLQAAEEVLAYLQKPNLEAENY